MAAYICLPGEFFCDKSAGAWDPAMWEDHKMSNWVTDWYVTKGYSRNLLKICRITG